MGYGCYGPRYTGRSFLSKEEKIQLLREYHQNLKGEVQGVEERIKELETN
jgi:hypothetical protein